MISSFWQLVDINPKIQTINNDALVDAVRIAFSSNKYNFYNSCWFIDIKEKFRIFRLQNITYIAKKISSEKADKEISSSLEAFAKLDGKVVGTKTMRVVVPKKIAFSGSDQCFLVSEYLGSDMHDDVYKHKEPSITLKECFQIINLLMENGITYSGFLPRNIVATEDSLYFFDWETAKFSEPGGRGVFDHLWRTNFLLNWSYVFDYHGLITKLGDITGLNKPLEQPPLVDYENTFKVITNIKAADSLLRQTIDKIVFGSELPLSEKYEEFYIRPNDMGHVVSDIFPVHIDVLHDMLAFSLRMHNERTFFYNLRLMTSLLGGYYKEILILKRPPEFSLQYYLLIPILMMIDEYISEDKYIDILSANSFYGLITKVSKACMDGSITQNYLSESQKKLSRLLDGKLRYRLASIYKEKKSENPWDIDDIIGYILTTRIQPTN